ncbi:MAG: riboflavin synthase [Actinomycetota bacterium]|nr:riboflavin synthase [Actinomycetota bacterium]
MFTGIVETVGTIRKARTRRGLLDLEIEAKGLARQMKSGDSIAVAGVCLTATATQRHRFSAQAMSETLDRTTLGSLERGGRVNLELPVRLVDRLGGHLVQGHIDGIAHVIRVEDDGALRVWMSAPDEVLKYLVPKGSVTLDGVSLTVVEVGRTSFQVALIPHTLDVTTLERVVIGDRFNVEVDVLAKYVERLMEGERWPLTR